MEASGAASSGNIDEIDIVVHKRRRTLNTGELQQILDMSKDLTDVPRDGSRDGPRDGSRDGPRDTVVNVSSDDSSGSSSWNFSHGVPKSMVLFLAQASFSLILVIFSMVKLSRAITPDEKTLYVSILTSQAGIFLPSPLQGMKKK